MKKKYVKFIDNGGFVLFPVSGLLVIGAVAIGAQILIGITLFVQLMLIAGYYTFKTNSIFREPLVRHSIEYCRIEAEEDAAFYGSNGKRKSKNRKILVHNKSFRTKTCY